MREYDVPLDGFTHDGEFYGFFTSNHFAAGQVMGRTVLARADGSLAADRAVVASAPAAVPGAGHLLAPGASSTCRCRSWEGSCWIWGSGPYRAGDLSLAVLDLDVARAGARGRRGACARPTWASGTGRPARRRAVWSAQEAEARPLFAPAPSASSRCDGFRTWTATCCWRARPGGPDRTRDHAAHRPRPGGRGRRGDGCWTGSPPGWLPTSAHPVHQGASLDDPIADRIFGAQAGVHGRRVRPLLLRRGTRRRGPEAAVHPVHLESLPGRADAAPSGRCHAVDRAAGRGWR